MNNTQLRAHLIYIMGASGSGKDSLMDFARARLAGGHRVVFAHRYITRPSDKGGENHLALTAEEFALRRAERLFALHWESHGFHYGIGIEINQWLDKGLSVVVNGSRGYFSEVQILYPHVVPVLIDVSIETLRDRLRGRGRESEQEVNERLDRHGKFADRLDDYNKIDNNSPLENGGEELAALIRGYCSRVITL